MAFENINWQLPVQAQQARQARFDDMIGNIMAMKQHKDKMDLRQRQMDMKANEPELANVKRIAENAVLKQKMGIPLNQQETAAIQSMAAIDTPKTYTNEFGQQITQPSPWQSIMGGERQPGGRGQQAQPMAEMMGTMPKQVASLPPRRPRKQPQQGSALPQAPMQPRRQQTSSATQELESMSPEYQGTPAQQVEAGEASVDLKKYAAEKGIDLENLPKKKRIELEFDMMKERRKRELAKDIPSPSDEIAQQKFEQEKKAAQQKSELRKKQRGRYADVVTENIMMSLDELESGGLPEGGTLSYPLSFIGETGAGKLKSFLEPIRDNVAFERLDQMRASSPTGGAVGQLTDKEREALGRTMGNLDQFQDPDLLSENLKRLYNQYMDAIHGAPEEIEKVGEEKGLPIEQIEKLKYRYNTSFDELDPRATGKKKFRYNPQTGQLEPVE